ncbi:LysR family transcriptional regulator [Shewanella maritima]|uniref:LysR family transcriptional regulator n=1 Tax=Shewanella maritima TaxID=2520507 RepID=UPI0037353B28
MHVQDLALFIRIADCGSISAAAIELDMSAASASAAVKRLEKELGANLFIRTTRNLRLTEQGERYLIHCRRALDDLTLGQQAIMTEQDDFAGAISISVSSDFGRNLFLPWLEPILQQHPKLSVRLHMGDQLSDFYRDKIDVGLRYGKPEDSTQVAFEICKVRRLLCGSANYIAQKGAPSTPDELRQHQCLIYKLDERTHDQWQFSREQQQFKVRVTGTRSTNDAEIARKWAVADQGLVFKSTLDLADDIINGRLQPVMPNYLGEQISLYLVCPSREQVTPVIIMLREMLRQQCKRLLRQVSSYLPE